MKHTPYGYNIVGGKAVVDEEKAENLKKIIDAYLSGMSFAAAAETVGLKMSHCGVKRMIQNTKYLGDSFYPAILSEETARRIEEERLKRAKQLGRDNKAKKSFSPVLVETEFTSPKAEPKYDDPVLQAQYAYSLIESGVKA